MASASRQSSTWAKDIPASIVVFLVALPLCLGIALASEAPLFSGIIAGIIGGVVIGALSGSEISVSGPAAGLAVIVAGAIESFGGDFRVFLVAVVLAGGLQLLLGLVRAGSLVNYVPSSVIRGMLSGIGVVILLKQIPHALGRDEEFEGSLTFIDLLNPEGNTLTDIINAVQSASLMAIIISGVSLAILILWEQPFIKQRKWSRLIPGPLVVVVLGIAINELLGSAVPRLKLLAADGHMVELPVPATLGEFFNFFSLPKFDAAFASSDTIKLVIQTAIVLALVASLETLLSLEAADKLDPLKRLSSKNKELRAQGLGNALSGLVGGLPITAVIVRTTANIYSGSATRWSAIIHGALLFLTVMLIPAWLNYIPLSSLAAILIVVGYRLASYNLIKRMYASGMKQFVPFVITVLAILFIDLLYGVLIGLLVGFFFVLRGSQSNGFTMASTGKNYLIRINKDVSFLNKNELKEILLDIPLDASIIIDGTRARIIDDDIYQEIEDFAESCKHTGRDVELRNLHSQAPPAYQDRFDLPTLKH